MSVTERSVIACRYRFSYQKIPKRGCVNDNTGGRVHGVTVALSVDAENASGGSSSSSSGSRPRVRFFAVVL